MDNRLAQRAHEAAGTIPRTYRAAVGGLVFALLTALPTAPVFAQAADDPLPAAKPLGEPLGEPLPAPAGPNDSLKFSAHFSADGKTVLTARQPLVAGSGNPSEARLWDVAAGKPLGPPLSFSPKGMAGPAVRVGVYEKTVVTIRLRGPTNKRVSDIQSWDAATGKSVWGPVTTEGLVFFVAFSPEGKTIVTMNAGLARLWDASTGKALGEHPTSHSVAFSPDGKTLVTGTGSPKGVGKAATRFLDLATGKPRGESLPNEGFVRHVAFSSDGKTVLTTAGQDEYSVRVWNVATGKPLGEPLRFPVPEGKKSRFYSPLVAYSPDGRTVLAATGEKTPQLWDALTGKTRGEALPHGDVVYRAAFSPDGKVLLTASGSTDRPSEVRLWDVATGKPFCRVPHKGDVTGAVFSPDGTVLLLASPQDARLWQVPKLGK